MVRPSTEHGHKRQQLLLAMILIAFALRLAGLGRKSLWIDEADSVYFAGHAWRSLLWHLCAPHRPGYYALLKLFVAFGGSSEFVVRLPSAIAGTLAVAALARLTHALTELQGSKLAMRRRFGARSLPALLLTVAPLHVWYSQEARMYAWVTLLSLGAAVFAVRLAQKWRWGCAMGYVATAAAAVLVDQSATPVLAVIIGSLTLYAVAQRRWGVLTRWLGLQSVPMLLFYSWVHQTSYASQIDAGTLYPLTMVRMTLDRWSQGWNTFPAVLPWQFTPAGLAMIGILIVSVTASIQKDKPGRQTTVAAMKRGSPVTTLKRILSGTFAGSRAFAWLILAAYVAGTVASMVPRLYTLKRLFVSLLPYALMIVAWALTRLSARRRHLGLVLAASLALSLVNIVAIPKAPWREGCPGSTDSARGQHLGRRASGAGLRLL